MKPTDFYRLSLIRNKFDSGHIKAVRDYLKSDDPVMLPGQAAAAICLLSATATEGDIRDYGQLILNALTIGYNEPETLQYIVGYILSDELNAATVERLTFDRRSGKVIIKLVDDSEIKVINLPTIATPDWKADAGIVFDRQQLVLIASELQESDAKGEIISDEEFQELIKEDEREYQKLNNN